MEWLLRRAFLYLSLVTENHGLKEKEMFRLLEGKGNEPPSQDHWPKNYMHCFIWQHYLSSKILGT